MPITLPGLGSGLDVNALVDALAQIERKPIDAISRRQGNIRAATQTLSSFSTKLATLQTAARALSTSSGFSAFAVTSGDTTSIGVSASGAASAGGYDITVQQVAREQRTFSDAMASSSTAFGVTATLRIAVGSGTPVDIGIDPTDNLSSIANKINGSGARASAAVLFDGSQYRLQVRGTETGAANSLAFTETGISLGLSRPENTAQSAQDAVMLVDTLTVRRPTNQVTDVIPGVTLNLLRPTSGPVAVRVSADPTAMRQRVTAFVNAYNDMIGLAHAATGFGQSRAANPELAGDRTVRAAVDSIARIIASPVAGASGRYTSLGSVGLTSTREGTLQLDSDRFDQALVQDAPGVARLFVTDAGTGASGVMSQFVSVIDSYTTAVNAPLRERIDSFGRVSRRLAEDADRMQQRLDRYTQSLRAQFANVDKVMSRYRSLQNAVASIGGNSNSGSSGGGI